MYYERVMVKELGCVARLTGVHIIKANQVLPEAK